MDIISEKLVELCAQYSDDKKAEDILLMDMRQITDVVDFFIICTALSETHARGISNGIREKMKEHEQMVWHTEGYESGKWVLMDYVTVVVHIFVREYREYYSLERLWGDAVMTRWSEKGLRKK